MKTAIKNLIYFFFKFSLIRRGDSGAVYLTYDDGPHPENTDKILAVLSRYNVKATFFMLGAKMEEHPQIVHSIIDQGHTLAYHSYKHWNLKKLDFKQLREDFAQIPRLSEKFGYPISLYRPPFGDVSLKAFLLLIFSPIKIVMWSLDCRDSYDSQNQVIDNISPEKISDGEIILLHDDYEQAEQLIETVLRKYQEKGLNCKPLPA